VPSLKALLLALLLAACASPVLAHKPSDSYLTLRLEGAKISGQWDIALRDLDFALTLDQDGDGAIRWGEVRARQAAIAALALSSLKLTEDGAACALRVDDLLIDAHSDGAYAVLALQGACAVPPQSLRLDYTLFSALDPQHRGLVRLVDGRREQALVMGGETSSQVVTLTAWGQARAFADFVGTGVLHIWGGFDHLLFLISLLLPAVLTRQADQWVGQPRMRAALTETLKVVTAFTLAHSITLSLAATGVVALPARLTESMIALSVVLAALNNLRPFLTQRLWIVAFAFGLIHGFGFASVLQDLHLPRASLLLALLGFNLGVEFGQMAIVAVVVPLAWSLRDSGFYRQGLLPYGSMATAAAAAVWLAQRAFGLAV